MCQSIQPVTSQQNNRSCGEHHTVVYGKTEISFVSSTIVRIRYSVDGVYDNRPTLTVPALKAATVELETEEVDGWFVVRTADLEVRIQGGIEPPSAKNFSVHFKVGDTLCDWNPSKSPERNLGGTARTLDRCNGALMLPHRRDPGGTSSFLEIDQGIVSRDGWALFDDSAGVPLDSGWLGESRPPGQIDWYLFAGGRDYKKTIAEATRVFGAQPLPPRFAFGYWLSHYWVYCDYELKELVSSLHAADVPIDVLVIDMDWHKQGWTGYTWDQSYFPDPEKFLNWCRTQKLNISLNMHPADGISSHEAMFECVRDRLGLPEGLENIPFDCTDPEYMRAYFEEMLRPNENLGVRFWWLDWQQGTQTSRDDLDPLPWLNHLHYTDLAKSHPDKRALCFSRYGGIGSGRYPVGFSGDTFATWESLRHQVSFTARSANVLYGYWSHDIGGFFDRERTPELMVRWMQFGVFSPIVRTHSSKLVNDYRFFWQEAEPFRSFLTNAIKRRYDRVAYMYTECRKTYDTGLSLCRPMYYEHPEDEEAYSSPVQYYFGDALIVAPVVTQTDPSTGLSDNHVWLPEGRWIDTERGEFVSSGQHNRKYLLSETPVFVRAGQILPEYIGTRRLSVQPDSLRVRAYPGGTSQYEYYEDDGDSPAYQVNEYVKVLLENNEKPHAAAITIHPAVGSYPGFTSLRKIEVVLPMRPPPLTVSANGKPIPWCEGDSEVGWRYSPDDFSIVIAVGVHDLKSRLDVEVEFEENQLALPTNGLTGLAARIKQALQFSKVLETPWERELGALSQLGHAIADSPQHFTMYFEDFSSRLECLEERRSEILEKVLTAKRFLVKNRGHFESSWLLITEAIREFKASNER